MDLTREKLLASLDEQRRLLAESIVLTPVDSLPLFLADRVHTGFLHGLYISDKERDRAAQQAAPIQFAGRAAASRDLAAINDRFARSLGAQAGSLRLLSGLHAHAATFMSISASGQSVALLSPEAGGHFSTHAVLSRLGLRLVDLPIDRARMCIDPDAARDLIARERVDFVFVDRSEGLRYEDFAFLGAIEGPVKVFDASQYLVQLLEGRYENPLHWGFDLMLFSLHKSFPGPQKAGVVGREAGDVWAKLMAGLSTLVSSSHAENTYLAALTLLDRERLATYTSRMLSTAEELESALASRGAPVVLRDSQGSPNWPATHHIWLRCGRPEDAFDAYERLAAAGIMTNYRKLPYRLGHGLRLGTSFSALAGLDTQHMDELADLIQDALTGGAAPALLVPRVGELAARGRLSALVPEEVWLTP